MIKVGDQVIGTYGRVWMGLVGTVISCYDNPFNNENEDDRKRYIIEVVFDPHGDYTPGNRLSVGAKFFERYVP